MAIIVCNACAEFWEGQGSPAICPKCGVASFGIAVESNTTDNKGGSAKMTMGEAINKVISSYADKQDWIRLDALNQWATGIPHHYVMENLSSRYPEVKAFPAKYASLPSELVTELKEIGIEYPSYQSEDLRESAGSHIQCEIDSQCGEYFRQDIRRRIQEASDAEKKLLYLYAKYPDISQDREIISTDLHCEVWQGLFEASFGPTLRNRAIDVVRWFNVCNLFSDKGRSGRWWHYYMPRYATQIIDNIEDHTGVPQITDAKAYITNLVSEGNIPRLALLEIILGQLGNTYWISDWSIKELFELLYPAMFEKYAESMVGVMAKTESEFYFCPLNKDKILNEILEAKKNMVKPLVTIFDRVRNKVGTGDIHFQGKLAAYAGFVNLGGRRTLYFVLTPWIAPPQSRGFRDLLQQLPWIRDNRTPCVILTIDKFNPDLIKAIQEKGYQDICLITAEKDMNSLSSYLFGEKREPFDELMGTLQGLGYQVTDVTRSLRETWYPLVEDVVKEFAHTKFGWEELRNMASSKGISLPASERTKEGRIRALIIAEGLENFAKRIGYPFYSFEVTDKHRVEITVTSETGEAVVDALVSVGSSSINTNRDGRATFPSLLSGNHKITVRGTGFKQYEGEISIPREVIRTIRLATQGLPVGVTVSIVVRDESSRLLEGVLVSLGSSLSKVTDSKGTAEFQVVTGTYQLDLTKEGCSRISQRIEVANGVQLDYTLNRISAPTYSITFPPYSIGTTLVFGQGKLEGKIAWGYEIGKPLSYESIVTSDLTDMNEGHIGFFMSVRNGKSTLAASAILQAAFQSIPVVVIDPKPDYVSNMIPLSKGLKVTDAFTKGVAPRFENVRQDKRGVDLWQPVSFDYQGRKNELLFQIVTFTKERKVLPRTVQYKAPLLTLPSPEDEDFHEQCDEAATSLTQALPKAEGKGFNTLISKAMQQLKLENIQREFLLIDDLLKSLDSLEDETFTSRDVRSLKKILSDYQTRTSTFFAKEREQVSDIRELLNPKSGVTPITILDVSGLPAKGKSAAQQNFISQVCGQIYHYAQKNRGTRAVELLLVLDEAQGYLPDPTNQYNFVRKLIQEGPSLGIRVVLISQTPQDIEMTARQQLKTLILSNVPEGTIRYVAETFSLPADWRHKLNRAGRGTPLIINEKTAETGGALCNAFTSPQMVGLLTPEQIGQAMSIPQADF